MDRVLKANALEPLKVDLGGGGEHIYIYIYTHTYVKLHGAFGLKLTVQAYNRLSQVSLDQNPFPTKTMWPRDVGCGFPCCYGPLYVFEALGSLGLVYHSSMTMTVCRFLL